MRAPLRVALGGGGTDLPSYYREHGGFVVSTAIDKYVHMTVSARLPEPLPCSSTSSGRRSTTRPTCATRSCARRSPTTGKAARSSWRRSATRRPAPGLGSSGAYTVCAIKALARLAGRDLDPGELAEAACHLEIDVLGRSIGKQDQYAAAFGGVRAYRFRSGRRRRGARARDLSDRMRAALRDEVPALLHRPASARPRTSSAAGQAEDGRCTGSRSWPARRARRSRPATSTRFAELMHEHWEAKRRRAPGTVTEEMDALRERALAAGARGVISLGAGGGRLPARLLARSRANAGGAGDGRAGLRLGRRGLHGAQVIARTAAAPTAATSTITSSGARRATATPAHRRPAGARVDGQLLSAGERVGEDQRGQQRRREQSDHGVGALRQLAARRRSTGPRP